jgi:hypothetical protein
MSESQSWSRIRLLLPRGLRTGALLAATLIPLPVFAQTEAPPAPAAEPAPPAPPAEPAPAAPAVTTPTPQQLAAVTAVQAEPAAGTETPAVAASTPTPPDDSAKPLDVAVWGRLGNNIATPDGGDADAFADAEVDLLLSGKIHKYVGWQADFVATYSPADGQKVDGAKSTAAILDLIGKFELHDAFNVWFGRMLVPSDRSNFSGAWFMAPWSYPGFFVPGGGPIGPRQGAFGRNDGATVWGQFGGGLLKYYASVFDLTAPQTSPLYSSRINLSLINPEPGYYHSSTYYGGKDILAIGLSAQFKKDGSVGVDPATMMALTPDDYTGFSADVLFEKNLGGAGTIDLESAFYSYNGNNEAFDWSYYALASYLLPTEIGIGKLQPLVRLQQAKPSGGGDNANIITAQVGYAIKEYAARLALGWERLDNGPKTDTIFLGIQLQK